MKYTYIAASTWFASLKHKKWEQQEKWYWISIKNNNYINSRNQIRPESGINPFSSKTNSFLDRTFYSYIFISIQEWIRFWREGIYTGFRSDLIPGINIIIIFNRNSISFFLLFSFFMFQWSKSGARNDTSVIESKLSLGVYILQ